MNTQANFSEKGRVIASARQVQDALEQTDWRKYDGERVTGSTPGGKIYLIMNGVLQWIPNPQTYNNLFASWDGVMVNDYLVDNVPAGPALTSGAVLAKGSSVQTYLVTNGHKQWIPNETTFQKFAFNPGAVVTVPDVVIDFIPTGPNVG